jgi:hypothetical protein
VTYVKNNKKITMGVSNFFKFLDEKAGIVPVAAADIKPLRKDKNIVVDVYGSHYWKVKKLEQI